MSLTAKKIMAVAMVLLLGLAAGCDDQQRGSLIGGGTGAALGAIIGHQSGNAGTGALIGAGAGALAGNAIGASRDKEKLRTENEELRRENERLQYEKELERLRAENAALRKETESK